MRLVGPVIPPGTFAAAPPPTFALAGARLRPFRSDDAPRVVEAFDDPDIRYFHVRHLDLEQARVWIEEQDELWRTEVGVTWAVADATDDRMLGRVTLYLDGSAGKAEIAYWMLPEGRGRHLVTGACRLVMTWAHDVGIHRIELEHHPDNEPSRRVAEACGFTLEGVKRQHFVMTDGRHDAWLWSHLTGDPLRPPA